MTRAALSRNVLSIDTPEGVRFSLPLAGPASRFLAWTIDMLAIAAASSLAGQVVRAFQAFNLDAGVAVGIIAYFVISIGYGIGFEWFWHGQTPGKRVLGLKVLDANGLRLTFPQIALRNLMRFLDALPVLYLVGGAALLLSQRSQRLGDLVASTIVIEKRSIGPPELARLNLDEKFNSLLEIPHLAARLRQQASPEVVQLALQALLRRDELNPETRVAVFGQLAGHFRNAVKFPPEVTAALADERYVRNVLQIVMAKGRFKATR